MSNIIKDIASGDSAKEKLIRGVNTVADVVGSTMGFRGRPVLIEEPGGLANVTKDGFETLEAIHLDDPIENMASEILKEASQRQLDMAGDGTTTVIVIAQALVKYSDELVKKGISPIDIKNMIEKSRDKILEYIKEKSIPVTDKIIYDIAHTSSSADKEISDIVSEAFRKAGEFGSVAHFRSDTEETHLEHIEGVLVESGYTDEGFVNVFNDRTAVFDANPLILVSNINFKTVQQLVPFMEFALSNKRQLVIVSEMEFQVHDVVLRNSLEKKFPFAVVRPPSHGQKRKDQLADLAMVCGTSVITSLSGERFEGRAGEFLGEAKKITVGKKDTILVPSENLNKEAVDGKIKELSKLIETSTNNYEKKYLQDRIAKLHGGISIIKVGAVTESELKEKIARVDDSVQAVKSAIEEGVVAGGGILFFNAQDLDLDEVTRKSILAPIVRILSNAGKNIKEIELPCACNYPLGYDVKNYEVVDMIEAGILDSAKVQSNAIINAVSVANTILMANNVITFKRAKNE